MAEKRVEEHNNHNNIKQGIVKKFKSFQEICDRIRSTQSTDKNKKNIKSSRKLEIVDEEEDSPLNPIKFDPPLLSLKHDNNHQIHPKVINKYVLIYIYRYLF